MLQENKESAYRIMLLISSTCEFESEICIDTIE